VVAVAGGAAFVKQTVAAMKQRKWSADFMMRMERL
jgi:hypothetical protein